MAKLLLFRTVLELDKELALEHPELWYFIREEERIETEEERIVPIELHKIFLFVFNKVC